MDNHNQLIDSNNWYIAIRNTELLQNGMWYISKDGLIFYFNNNERVKIYQLQPPYLPFSPE